MTRLTLREISVLRDIAELKVEGQSYQYETRYVSERIRVVTRQVKALVAKGMADTMHFSGGSAAVNLTDSGRAYLAALEST